MESTALHDGDRSPHGKISPIPVAKIKGGRPVAHGLLLMDVAPIQSHGFPFSMLSTIRKQKLNIGVQDPAGRSRKNTALPNNLRGKRISETRR